MWERSPAHPVPRPGLRCAARNTRLGFCLGACLFAFFVQRRRACVLASRACCLCVRGPRLLFWRVWACFVHVYHCWTFVCVCVCVCSMCTGLVFCIRRPVIVCGLMNVCICVSTPITGLPPSTVSFGRTLMPCPLVCGRAWSSILLNSLVHDCKCIDDHEHL